MPNHNRDNTDAAMRRAEQLERARAARARRASGASADEPAQLQRIRAAGFEVTVRKAKAALRSQLKNSGKKYIRGTDLSWARGRIPEKHRGMLWKVWTGFARSTPGGLTRKDLVAVLKGKGKSADIRIQRWSRYQQGLKAYKNMSADTKKKWVENRLT